MKILSIHKFLSYLIAAVWLINGLFCKILNFVPRHEQIVSRILGSEYSRPMTLLIGISEVAMVIWILSRFRPKLNAVAQIAVIMLMNVIEFLVVPDLLLWGKLNIVFALMLVSLVFYNEFVLNKKTQSRITV